MALGATVPQSTDEYQVKAAFLLNFIAYTTWPGSAAELEAQPLVVDVVGPNPFGDTLEELLRDKRAHGRPLVVRHLPRLPERVDADVVFTAHPDPRFRAALIARTRGRPVLLVGEHEGFAVSGGHIGFFLSEHRVRFEVNPEAVKRSGLMLSSQLLKLARIVEEAGG